MAKLIVGLGNPGPKYRHTRHNVGFAVLAQLAHRHGIKPRPRASALVGEGIIHGGPVVLAQPLTMMNASGRAVAALCKAQNIHDRANMLVVVDEMDLPLGVIRVRSRGSAGGHNGLKSIIQSLGSQDFPRLRVGVGRPPIGQDPIDHLLSRFLPEELLAVEAAVERAADAVEYWLQHGTDETMNRFNRPDGLRPDAS
jgi:PTH1 family peptidyl-tRNA hydrolase